jgi:hypothetical protein
MISWHDPSTPSNTTPRFCLRKQRTNNLDRSGLTKADYSEASSRTFKDGHGRDGSTDFDNATVTKVARLSTASLSILAWSYSLQVAQIRALLPETGPDAAALSARFGRASNKRTEQIEGILETLRGLGL